jgi:hypothetical protein
MENIHLLVLKYPTFQLLFYSYGTPIGLQKCICNIVLIILSVLSVDPSW